ncbi:MAG: class I SAM-dependent methyltransferase [Magnetococcales bacterium]|nr:class I SAM-dependent methyltransferase [Magnetococcales bacterium]
MEYGTSHFTSESWLMRLFKRLGFEGIAWSLRRLHCPVAKEALVLEVGSGGNPYARSNLLLDAYETSGERYWVPLVMDRPTVLGLVENLPFRDKAFDFVIASHVLEHSSDPARFLEELQRVAKAGYIEVPDAFYERINPHRFHKLEITLRNETLLIRKKVAWVSDPDLTELYEHRLKPLLTTARFPLTGRAIPRHPFAFHVRYYWQDKIQFVVLNPEDDASWEYQEPAQAKTEAGSGPTLKNRVLNGLRTMLSQHGRNKNLDISHLLRCPACHAVDLICSAELILCPSCHHEYPIHNHMPRLFAPAET